MVQCIVRLRQVDRDVLFTAKGRLVTACHAGASKLESGAVRLAASNMLQYPFVLAFAQARAQNCPKDERPKDKDAVLAAIDESLLDPNVPTGVTASAKEDEEKLEKHAQSNNSGRGKGHDEEVHGNAESNKGSAQSERSEESSKGSESQSGGQLDENDNDEGCSDEEAAEKHKNPEVLAVEQLRTRSKEADYQFNEGEQLVMQVRSQL